MRKPRAPMLPYRPATSRINRKRSPAIPGVLVATWLLVILAACATPRPTLKIALVAPFEGRFRETGYDAFPALRLALRQQITANGNRYAVAFVAYNDDGDPALAERVSHNVAIDPQVIAVIGHLRLETTLAAMGVYTAAGLPLVVPDVPADWLPADPLVFRLAPGSTALSTSLRRCPDSTGAYAKDWQLTAWPYAGPVATHTLQILPDLLSPATARVIGPAVTGLCASSPVPYPRDLPGAEQALVAFSEVSGGFSPGPRSISTYDATRLILQAMLADAISHGMPSRAGVGEALRQSQYTGLLGRITFDAANAWDGAPVWVYRYDGTGVPRVLR